MSVRPSLACAALLLATACAPGSLTSLPSLAPTAPASPLPLANPGAEPIVQVVERVRHAVVNVTTNITSPESLAGGGASDGTGTGFIVNADGVVVTNYHVVEGGLSIRVVTADGGRFDARVIGGDPEADLAVLKIETDRPLPTVPLGDSDALKLGERVVALGFALALEGGPSVTSGIVSAMGRTITAGSSEADSRTYEDLIQTDAAINPGNSGGPLVDLSGRVVGINTAGVQASSAENIGFAIAIDRAKDVITDAIENPTAAQAYMGVSTQTVDAALAFQLRLPVDRGALVVDLAPQGPADRAGLDPGDIIVGIAGGKIATDTEVRDALENRKPGQKIPVEVVHEDGSRQTYTVTLGSRPLPIPG